MTTNRLHRPTRTRALLVAVAVAASVSACGDDTADDVSDAVDDSDDGSGALDDLQSSAADAADEVQRAIDSATGTVADAIDEVGEDTVEMAARNLASTNAAEEFSDAGYPIDGNLACTADATDDLTAVQIDCFGATEDGRVASMTGTTTELPGASITELEGDFIGLIDDEEVFRTNALG